MANQVDRITKVRIQQSNDINGNPTYSDPYAIGTLARYVLLDSGISVEQKLQELGKQTITGLSREGYVLKIKRAENKTATNSTLSLWDYNSETRPGVVAATGGKVNAGKVWKIGSNGKPSWAPQDKTKVSQLPVFKPATSAAAGVQGLVPAPKKNQQACFLRGDGNWVVPTGALKNAIGQAGYVNATTTAANYYNSFWSVGHVPANAGTGTTQTNFPAWRRNAVCFVGAKSTANGYAGLVPAPQKGQENMFLQGNGTWGNPSKGTWKPNKIDQAGYVDSPGSSARSQFWGVDKTGKLGWTNFNNIIIQGDNVIFSGNGSNDTFLRGDGKWASINTVLNGKVETKLVMANSILCDVNKNLLLPLNSKNNEAGDWRLLTLDGLDMKGRYMAIANVSVDTARSKNAFPNVSSQDPYIATIALDGYLRAVLNITDNDNAPVLNNDIFGYAPSQNTITKFGGSVTTCYEWSYDGSVRRHIYLAARYYAKVKLQLCYNIIILKLS